MNVGLPRQVTWRGRAITTSIFKDQVAGRVAARALNLDGDRQTDVTVHDGREKAVYASPPSQLNRSRSRLASPCAGS